MYSIYSYVVASNEAEEKKTTSLLIILQHIYQLRYMQRDEEFIITDIARVSWIVVSQGMVRLASWTQKPAVVLC